MDGPVKSRVTVSLPTGMGALEGGVVVCSEHRTTVSA